MADSCHLPHKTLTILKNINCRACGPGDKFRKFRFFNQKCPKLTKFRQEVGALQGGLFRGIFRGCFFRGFLKGLFRACLYGVQCTRPIIGLRGGDTFAEFIFLKFFFRFFFSFFSIFWCGFGSF